MAKKEEILEVAKELSDNEIDKITKNTGELLSEMPKIRIKIPRDQLNKEDDFVPVSVNGFIYQIKRGEAVSVPETVADILTEAGYI